MIMPEPLEEQLSQMPPTTERVDLLNELSWHYRYSNIAKSRDYSTEAFDLSNKLKYKKGLSRAVFHKAMFSFWLSLEDNYLADILSCLDIFEKDNEPQYQVKALNLLGAIYDNYGDYEKALDSCRKGIETAEANNYLSGKADCVTTMGQVYLRTGDYDLAIQHLNEGLILRLQLNEQMAACSSFNLLARSYMLQKNYSKAEEYYYKSLELRNKINDTYGIPWTYLGLASLHEQNGDYDRAIALYEQGLELNSKYLNEKRYQVLVLLGIGKSRIKISQFQSAIDTLEQAFCLAVETKLKPVLTDIHKELAQAYETINDTAKTIFHYKEYIKLKEEILNNETNNRLKKQQIAFGVEKARKEAEIYQLKNVELKRIYDALEQRNSEILSSITYAKRIQDALIPPSLLIKKYLSNSFILYKPKDVVSGDFYWMENKGDLLLFAVVDCTGHGVPGAFVSIIGHNGLNRCVNEFGLVNPSHILDKLTELVLQTFEKSTEEMYDGMDIALCSLNLITNEMEYAGANNSLYCISNGEFVEIKADRQPIGRYHNRIPFTNHKLQLHKDDSVYIFSDGYSDQFGGESGKKFKSASFKQLLLSISHEEMQKQKDSLLASHLQWKGNLEQTDDICVIGLKI